MYRKNFLKDKLELGERVLGTFSIIPSVVVSDIISSSGLDFIIIDAEHGPVSFEVAQQIVMACESRGCSPIMRVSSVDESSITKALDIGVHCIQLPNIDNAEDVKKAVKWAKYPPVGNRGFSPFTRAGEYSICNAKSLTKKSNENVMIAIQIEGKKALDQIDEILDVQEVDIVFVGLFDLSKALGKPGCVNSPEVLEVLSKLVSKINKAGKYPATITTSVENIDLFMKMGVKSFAHLVDCEMMRSSYEIIKQSYTEIERKY
jgi:2-keto-3-deoxy-L-rhamnonate aldolase RhmA